MSCERWSEWLDLYVDDSCTPEETAAVEEHLRTCNSCSVEALGRLQMKRSTRAAAAARYLPAPGFQLSPEFFTQMRMSGTKDRMPFWRLRWAQGLAAGALVFVLTVAFSISAWMRHTTREAAMAELLDLHVATLASANPVDVISTDRHTVKPWFQGKLPFTFNLPELQNSPFKLLGGKLMYFKHNPGAQLLFEVRKHQISVFILQDQPGVTPPGAGVATTRQKGFSVETWSETGLRYAVIGDTEPADVHDLSELLRAAGRQ
jgi:anti-sigma factor RsiW